MKTTLIAAAAISLVACASPSEENAASSEASVDSLTITTRVDVEVAADTLDLRCEIGLGWNLSLSFQDRRFVTYVADHSSTCQTILAQLAGSGVRHGTLTKERTAENVFWTLNLGDGLSFNSQNAAAEDNGVVFSTTTNVDLLPARDLTEMRCRMVKGPFLFVRFDDSVFSQPAGFSLEDCDELNYRLVRPGYRSGTFTKVIFEDHTYKRLQLDGGDFDLQAWN